ncbi:MAG: NAD(P)H-hydrate epimerase [Sedimentisphaerales bacterium]|nr:NAD(P)H-hydrate epimerase [Sedimentisphaerales bacterium]
MEKYSPNKNYVVLSRDQVRAFDAWAINELGIPGVVLMENAGRSCAELIKEKLKSKAKPKVCIFCGTGNNGGDGYVIARQLLNNNFMVKVVIIGDRKKIKGDAAINLQILQKLSQSIESLDLETSRIASRIKSFTAGADMLVDGIFGTGLEGPVRGDYKILIDSINSQICPILAIDIPSGLDCDTGQPLGTAIRADYTVTFAAAKAGFKSATALQYTGQVFVASIGIDPPRSRWS